MVAVEEDWKMIADLDGKKGNRDGGGINRMPKKDMVVKEGDHLDLGDQHLLFHHHPGHTPGVLTTEGIKVYDGGKPYTAILMGGGGYRGGLKEAEQSLITANQVAAIKGVQVNLQIHSWAEPNGYPGGGVLERAMMMKNRKPGDPHPFVDPATWDQRAKAAVAGAMRAVETEKAKAAAKYERPFPCGRACHGGSGACSAKTASGRGCLHLPRNSFRWRQTRPSLKGRVELFVQFR